MYGIGIAIGYESTLPGMSLPYQNLCPKIIRVLALSLSSPPLGYKEIALKRTLSH